MNDKYRFINEHLYEYDEQLNAYIHCYHHALVTTITAAIKNYEADDDELGYFEQFIDSNEVML